MKGAGNHDMQINVLMSALVVVFALSKVTQDEGMVEFWIILMPVLTYAIGCANARKKQADLKMRLVGEMRESSTPEYTLSVFDDMVEQGLAPDEAALNKAMCACARLGKIDRALQVREQMPLYGFFPGAEANVALIRACTSAGRVGEALDIFEECAQPSHLAYRDAIHCYIEAERLGRAVMLYKEMAQSDMLPCAKTFQRLSGAVREQGLTDTAAELLEAFAGWVKRIDAMAEDDSDASTEFSENMGDIDSE
jgi:pentatricopeptide repeat protein